MVALTQTTGLIADTLRLVRATILRLTSVATADPAPYWADYLRETRDRRS